MDVFEYHCWHDGLIAAYAAEALEDSKPPSQCPLCGGGLSVQVRHEYEMPAA
jgi:hypothetical protein